MRNLIFVILFGFLLVSCSSDDNGNISPDPQDLHGKSYSNVDNGIVSQYLFDNTETIYTKTRDTEITETGDYILNYPSLKFNPAEGEDYTGVFSDDRQYLTIQGKIYNKN